MEPQIGRGITENTIQSRHDDSNPFSNLPDQVGMKSEQVLPRLGDPKSMEPENSIQPRYDDGNTHSTMANQVNINSGLLQTLPAPGGHTFVEPDFGREISENAIQPRHADGNTHSTLTNQVYINSGLQQTLPTPGGHKFVEPGVGRGISENTIQPRYDDSYTHSTSTNQVDINYGRLQSAPDGHKPVEPRVGRGIYENTNQPREGDINFGLLQTMPALGGHKSVESGVKRGIYENTIHPTHSTLTDQVDINYGPLQTLQAPGAHKFVEPEVGSWKSENTIQPTYDYGNTHTTLNNQVDIKELLQTAPVPGNAVAVPIVANQAETVTSAASAKSGGSPSGSNSANNSDIGMLPDPEGNHVQSVSSEPVSFTPEASGWSIISESPPSGISEPLPGESPPSGINESLPGESPPSRISESLPGGPGYSIHEYMAQADVDWRNLNSSPIQNMVHQDDYDPNRIPASVFKGNSASPMDWSTASNESLFSIYMGNSFSGYQGMFQSGEFSKTEKLNKQQNPFEPKANEGSNFSPGLPTLPATSSEPKTQQGSNIKDDINLHEGLSKRPMATIEESKENHENWPFQEENLTDKGGLSFETTNSSPNCLSNDSAKSLQSIESHGSFAFPVLVTDLGKSSSFNLRSDMKKEHITHHHHEQQHPQQPPQQQQMKQHSEPSKTTTTHAALRYRGCLSWFSGWRRCW